MSFYSDDGRPFSFLLIPFGPDHFSACPEFHRIIPLLLRSKYLLGLPFGSPQKWLVMNVSGIAFKSRIESTLLPPVGRHGDVSEVCCSNIISQSSSED